MASSKKFLRTPSEILDCLEDCPSESDFMDVLDSDENEDSFVNEVVLDAENNSSSDSESESAESDLDERVYDPPPDLNYSTDEEASGDNEQENEWEEYDSNRHKLKNHKFSGKQQFFPPPISMSSLSLSSLSLSLSLSLSQYMHAFTSFKVVFFFISERVFHLLQSCLCWIYHIHIACTPLLLSSALSF